jgi:hypothetical protein
MFMMDGYTPSQFLSMADAVTSEARPVQTHGYRCSVFKDSGMKSEPAASESLKVLKSKVAEKELPQRLFLFVRRSMFRVRRSMFEAPRNQSSQNRGEAIPFNHDSASPLTKEHPV